MISIVPDISWPETLPLPLLDYAGRPRYAVLSSPKDNAFIARRSRFTKAHLAVSVSWMLVPGEYDAFRTFYTTTLGNGTAVFPLEIRYPQNSVLTEWTVRFRGGYTAMPLEGLWNLTAELELINPIDLGSLAGIPGAVIDTDLFDILAGLVLEGSPALGYDALEYLDIDLGAILEGDATLEQILDAGALDDDLGLILLP
jgi:hypothetical protein